MYIHASFALALLLLLQAAHASYLTGGLLGPGCPAGTLLLLALSGVLESQSVTSVPTTRSGVLPVVGAQCWLHCHRPRTVHQPYTVCQRLTTHHSPLLTLLELVSFSFF